MQRQAGAAPMTVPLIGEFIASIVYLTCGLIAMTLWSVNPFIAIIPIDAAIYYWLFAPNLQDSCCGFFVGSCRFDRWMGEHKWSRMER
jgi:hypothetical protein